MNSLLSYRHHIGCLGTLGALGNIELYLISFIEGFETVFFNGGEMYEDISSVISGDKPITLLLVEPFHTTFGHYNSPPLLFKLRKL